jgi:hypothetical protein
MALIGCSKFSFVARSFPEVPKCSKRPRKVFYIAKQIMILLNDAV